MNSRFKFVQSVNPQPIPTNTIKPKFSKLTLASTKLITVESSINQQKDKKLQATQTVTRTTTTTTTTTMTKVFNDLPVEIDTGDISCAQKPKILLYESTKDENHSDILTDDDTDSVGSSIDSKEIAAGLKEISQPTTQGTVAHIERIETQMQQLSFLSPSDLGNVTVRSDENIQNISRQFDQIDLQCDQEDNKSQEKIEKSVLSIQTLSSNDTMDQEQVDSKQIDDKSESDDVIVLSDSETEENVNDGKQQKRNISQEPPLKPSYASSNNAAMYNISPIDSKDMQKVNNFFDNVPFCVPAEAVETSFNTSHFSKSVHEDIYVPETTDEESIDDKSAIESSVIIGDGDDEQKQSELNAPQMDDNDVEQNNADLSDNNIIVDIPVTKSTSDQPRQLIRSQSGVRLTASRSSPITKTGSGTSNNIVHRKPGLNSGSSIRVNSSNGQVNIAAKININIQIVEDSSEESSEDNKPRRKSEAVQSSENFRRSTNSSYQSENSNQTDDSSLKSSCKSARKESKNTRTPNKNSKINAIETPTTASKIKQFEFVAPKSMTKNKKPNTNESNENIENKVTNKSIGSENSEKDDGFQIDKSIPISPRDQKLLHKVYGDAWKTPEVIKSYSAVKGKPVDRAATNDTPTIHKIGRYSKGFDLFKQKIKSNFNSTRLEDHAEISIIETPDRADKIKTPEKVAKPKPSTPRSKVKPLFAMKKPEFEQSPSVLTKKKPSPKSTKKKAIGTSAAAIAAAAAAAVDDSSIITPRPRRNIARKPILQSDDESDKDNVSDNTDDSSYSETDADILTEDDDDDIANETESIPKPKSVRSKNTIGTNSTKRPVKKRNKNGLIYLDLSSEEIVTVDENHHTNVSEEDLANITRKFLETDLNDDKEKPKKKIGRKLFTQNYDDIDLEITPEPETPRSVKKKSTEEASLNIEIPRFTHKLFDSKKFGSPSINKTPKTELRKDDLNTPVSSKILAERKTPFGSARSKLDSPPKTFKTYGFLKSLDVQASMILCHPEAKKYRDNFRGHKEELTSILYKMYNEQVFENKLNVDIQWNKKLTMTAGRFHGRSKPPKVTGKNHYIELSEKVLTSADRLRCTLIHEMCHAATWIFNNEGGHGVRWKSWAKKANLIFPELPTISVCHSYEIEYKYTYKCDMCHSKSYSHSKSKKVENIRCSYCHGSISIFLNKKKDGKIVMEPVREANGFAKFVKVKYKDYKKPGVKHADVMRQISQEYSTLSQEEKKKF